MPPDIESAIRESQELVATINEAAVKNLGFSRVFGEASIQAPQLNCAEACFIKMVAWLYVHYFEVGKIGVEFLLEKFSLYEVGRVNFHQSHFSMVKSLRTFSQHNMNLAAERDNKIFTLCQDWLESQCGCTSPHSEKMWRECLQPLCFDARDFYRAILHVVTAIVDDSSRDQILEDWNYRLTREHMPHEFDSIIEIAANDMGRAGLDVRKLRNRFHSDWNAKLKSFRSGYDFATEARRLVENTILSHFIDAMPVDGTDVLALGVPPGEAVGKVLKKTKISFISSPCSRDELLMRMQEFCKEV